MSRSLLVCWLLCAAFARPVSAEEGKGRNPKAKEFWDAVHAQRTDKQRAIIEDFFDGRRGGTFVDVGAAHHQDLSMTYLLEKRYDWSGLAIDALDHWRAGYEEHRPRTRFLTYIVTDETGAEQPFYRLKGDIGSTAVKQRADVLSEKGVRMTEVLVPTITMNDLLDAQEVTKIDFLSMDIEGGEQRALAGFDIERFRPELVGIEVFPEAAEGILAYFDQHGYERIAKYLDQHEGDWYFTCRAAADCASSPKALPDEPARPRSATPEQPE